MRRVSTRLGELDCQVVDAIPEGKNPELAVVLCHGYGAPATDLVPLARELVESQPELGSKVRFVFPAAPLSLASLGMPSGRAWFHLSPELAIGREHDWNVVQKTVPEGLAQTRRALTSLLSALSVATKLPYGKIVLGGFSQGGMVTTDLALRLEEAPAGLCILSGTLICQDEWKKWAAKRKGLPVLQAHGRYDDMLAFAQAEKLRDLLKEAGLLVDFLPFDGPHTIAPEELQRLAEFIHIRLQKR
ncbi:alpha/beta hydrolase [Melittangium boletus]|uniref:Phospholipase/carboxylesterase n=1 Tax=Melittangium boletus DSM 14713 TaxID=1294270 RepID=A0A250IHH3_9BACT|nr:phospholipase [Melittangium boletus]ATB31195.1 phospholipase/carboxylesterase [Melittangium boletus DSM 14713]